MKKADFYYKEIYLGTLYENGQFNYIINSNDISEKEIELIAHTLSIISESTSLENFDFNSYIDSWNNFVFPTNFYFKLS